MYTNRIHVAASMGGPKTIGGFSPLRQSSKARTLHVSRGDQCTRSAKPRIFAAKVDSTGGFYHVQQRHAHTSDQKGDRLVSSVEKYNVKSTEIRVGILMLGATAVGLEGRSALRRARNKRGASSPHRAGSNTQLKRHVTRELAHNAKGGEQWPTPWTTHRHSAAV
eukprot:CAMPEP_0118936886 /NCGR_PEP_ID=MMETSP1169-20130426/20873_1 /TAXON_ID=36882 /ORGANISM="Pyramimonas obovata, Strain CCMP722" /LENGTH=164 /DNA_ID=CAMNT_0006880321 /DNA_START=95 /DNA_END=586 /DNA_ORIENTATION=+